MIVGLGTDIVNISRIEESISKFGDAFINKCFSEKEIAEASAKPHPQAAFSKRFAAKEAFYKALGTGFTHGVSWQDLEISNDEHGKPQIAVTGNSLDILKKLTPNPIIHLTLSDDKPFATAVVIIEEK